MKALYIGDNLKFGADIVSPACQQSNISIKSYINTRGLYLGTGNKSLRIRDSSFEIDDESLFDSWMKKNNILWQIYEEVLKNKRDDNDNHPIDCFIIQAETQFKDGESLSGHYGLELLKHILLTDHPNLRKVKIIVLSFFDLHYLIRHKPDNVILLSPYVDLIPRVVDPNALGDKIHSLVSTYNRDIYYEDEDYDRNLSNYVIILQEEETEANHQERNLTGIDSLYRELFEDEEKYRKKFAEDILNINEEYREDIWKLYHKKMVFKGKMQWEFYREVPLSDAEKEVFKDMMPQEQSKWTQIQWALLFKDIINQIKNCNIKKVLAIEDKSYWTAFYKRIFGDKLIIATSSEDAEDINNEKYVKSINKWYNSGMEQFKFSIEKQVPFKPSQPKYVGPDLSIIDIFLSVADEKKEITSGIEQIGRLKNINRLAPVIICSASKNNEKIRKALKTGADELFIKDIGGLRNLLLKLYKQSRNASLKKHAGELIHILEDEEMKIPCLVPNDDESWHMYKQEPVLTIREMKIDERFKLVRDIELSIEEGYDTVWKTICDGFIDKTILVNSVHKSKARTPKGNYWNSILKEMYIEFMAHKGKKCIHFDNCNRDFDDTEQLLYRCKPVRVRVKRKGKNDNDEYLVVEVINTRYLGIIYKSQVLLSGYTPLQFDTLKKVGSTMMACRRKYFGMPEELVNKSFIQLDLIAIDN